MLFPDVINKGLNCSGKCRNQDKDPALNSKWAGGLLTQTSVQDQGPEI